MADETVDTLGDFMAGFAEEASGPSDDSPLADPVAQTPESPEPEGETDDGEVEGDPEGGAGKIKAEAPKDPAPPAAKEPERGMDDLLSLLDQRLPKTEAKQETAPAPVEEPTLSAEQQTRLGELKENWKEVSELLELQSKLQTDAIAKQVAEQVAAIKAEMEAKLQPVEQTVATSAQAQYESTVKGAHPEVYDEKTSGQFIKDLQGWVNQQPDYLREAYIQAYNSPNPKHAVDLLTRFKNETGKYKAPEAKAEETPPKEGTPPVEDELKRERLKRMRQPASRSSSATESTDPLDFEGGFNEMARTIDKSV